MTLFSPRIPYAIHLFLLLLKSPSGLVCFRQVICASVDSVYEDRVRMVLSKTYKIPLLKIIFTHWAVVYSWDIFLIRSCAIPVIESRILIFYGQKHSYRDYENLCPQYIHTHSQYIGTGRENCYIRWNVRKAYILLFWAMIAWIFFTMFHSSLIDYFRFDKASRR